MIGTKFYKPIQNDELPVYEDKPVFETVVVMEEKTATKTFVKVDTDGKPILDANGKVVTVTEKFTFQEPKLDENGQPVTVQKQVFDENGKPVTQREQVGTKPNDAPNTVSKYAQAAQWCNANKAFIEDKGEYYEVIAAPEPTEEEKQAFALAQAKQERASEVERLTVKVEGMVFDADETSQARMSVAASSMTDDELNVWVLHDNSVVQVTKAQLLQACRLARIAQSAVWTKPYENSVA